MTFSSRVREKTTLRQENRGKTLALEILPLPKSAHNARLAISSFIARHVPDSNAATEFMLAVGEALANAIEHGASSKAIQIAVHIDASSVTVIIEDHGCGFNPRKTSTQNLPALDSERGRGLPIISYCTDSFTIDSCPDAGTRVALCRNLD